MTPHLPFQKTATANSRLTQHGLPLPAPTLAVLEKRGIYCVPGISVEHQHLARRYVLRGIESGGAVSDIGRACAYFQMDGAPAVWLQPIDSIAVNGRHAIVIADHLVRMEMLRVGHTYELAISSHSLAPTGGKARPVIASQMLFRGHQGTLALELWKDENRALRGEIAPTFYNRSGEFHNFPSHFEGAIRKLTSAVCCIGCRHTHVAIPPISDGVRGDSRV